MLLLNWCLIKALDIRIVNGILTRNVACLFWTVDRKAIFSLDLRCAEAGQVNFQLFSLWALSHKDLVCILIQLNHFLIIYIVFELASATALLAQPQIHQKILFWSSRFKAWCSLAVCGFPWHVLLPSGNFVWSCHTILRKRICVRVCECWFEVWHTEGSWW